MSSRTPVDIDENELRRLHAEGLGDAEIAQRLGVAHRTLARRRSNLGLAPNHTGPRRRARAANRPPAKSTKQPDNQTTSRPPKSAAALRKLRINIIKSTWQRVITRQLEATQ